MNLSHMVTVATSTLEALKFMHSQRIIHGNVTLRNLLITPNGYIKLCDFSAAQKYPYTCGNRGKLAYSAPELVRGGWAANKFGTAVDIYAFGITMIGELYNSLNVNSCVSFLCIPELLDDIVPYSALTRIEFIQIMKDCHFTPPTVQGLRFEWHATMFGKYVDKALDIHPLERWSASQLLEAFRKEEI